MWNETIAQTSQLKSVFTFESPYAFNSAPNLIQQPLLTDVTLQERHNADINHD